MKKMKFLSVLAVVFAALSFTACNSDTNSDSRPDPETARVIMNAVANTDGGKLIYVTKTADGSKLKADTLDRSVSWTINANDSMLTVHDFPVEIMANYVANNNDLKEAIANYDGEPVSLKAICAPWQLSNYYFLLYPQTITIDKLTYGGASHKVQFMFYYGTTYSGGYIGQTNTNSTTKQLLMQVLLGGIVVDENTNTNYMGLTVNGTSQTPYFLFIGSKSR